MRTEGYLILALGRRHYYAMAENLAISLRIFDPRRRIALLCDSPNTVADDRRKIFDDVVVLDNDPRYIGVANKLRIFEHSPYDRAFYIDADCLLVKPDMDRHFNKFSGQGLNVAGSKITSGRWHNIDISKACKALSVPYIVQMNSGVIFHEKSEKADAVIAEARRLYCEEKSMLGAIHQGRSGQWAHEPFLGAALGSLARDPVEYEPKEGTIMISTWRARRIHADLAFGNISIDKASDFYIFGRFFAKKWVRHYPSVLHFIALKPRTIYNRLCYELLQRARAERILG